MSEPTLTEEDREALGDWWDSDWPDTAAGAIGTLYETVERIVARHRAEAAAAALRPVQALADRWHRHHDTLNADGVAMLAGVFLAIAHGRKDAQ